MQLLPPVRPVSPRGVSRPSNRRIRPPLARQPHAWSSCFVESTATESQDSPNQSTRLCVAVTVGPGIITSNAPQSFLQGAQALMSASSHVKASQRGTAMKNVCRLYWPGVAIALLLPFGSPSAEKSGATGVFEEIVVTARKREETAQSVPIPITAVSEDIMATRPVSPCGEPTSSTKSMSIPCSTSPAMWKSAASTRAWA